MSKKRILNTLIVLTVSFPLIVFFLVNRKSSNNQQKTIKIGVILSQTGNYADYGKRALNGITWATEKINKDGGIHGEKIELVVLDTKSQTKEAPNALHRLINDNVKIIVGDVISGTTLKMAPIAEKNKVILFAPGASSPQMYNQGKYIFRNWTSDEFDGRAIAEFAITQNDSIFGVIAENQDYSLDIANEFKKNIVKLGGDVELFEVFETGSDLSTQVLKLKESSVPNIYISAYSKGTGIVLKKSKEIDFSPNFYSTLTVNTPDCKKIAGNLINDVFYTTPSINLESNQPYIRGYVDGFKERFNDKPEETSAHGYDAMMILGKALSMDNVDIDSINTELVRNNLLKIKKFKGVTGEMSFDKDGNVLKNIFIKKIVNDKEVILDTIKFLKD